MSSLGYCVTLQFLPPPPIVFFSVCVLVSPLQSCNNYMYIYSCKIAVSTDTAVVRGWSSEPPGARTRFPEGGYPASGGVLRMDFP